MRSLVIIGLISGFGLLGWYLVQGEYNYFTKINKVNF